MLGKVAWFIWRIVSGIIGIFGIVCLALALAALFKSQDITVVRNGFTADYQHIALVMGGIGTPALLVAIFGLTLRRKLPPPSDQHF